ncbi:uncharacterized protein LOC127279448 [Leptopilina boulardi]|uniref:uncharacterized protein LOC127279448 n=1 Tax=Leptopilina boulardi TaxID=63433 RepID=UPI0021F5B4C4|nr:uncharacterized protein LOC127279448 [Leptopilina boulardi]
MLSIFLGKFPTGLETTFGKSFKKISQMKGLKLIKDLSDRAMELLGRPLKYYELQMFSSPRVCAVCFECNPHLLTNCKKCPQSSFCEMHINDPSHENQCFKFISTLYSPCGIYETVPPLILDIIDEMKLPVQTEFEKLPNSMTKFFERYFSKVSFHLFSIEKRVAFNTYFSSKYSSSLTILFAMEKLSLNLNSMTIHVVGASTHEQIFNDWEAILHYLPQLNKLKIVLIGLEFIPPGSVKMQKQCKLCKKNKRQFIIETIMIEYHKYCDSENFEKPDMIACFNPGFYAYKSWEKSIEIFNKGQCPVLITSYNEMEGNQDKEIVDKKFPSANCIFNDYNPFASFYFKTLYVVCDFSADNEFIFIYKHLGNLKVSK